MGFKGNKKGTDVNVSGDKTRFRALCPIARGGGSGVYAGLCILLLWLREGGRFRSERGTEIRREFLLKSLALPFSPGRLQMSSRVCVLVRVPCFHYQDRAGDISNKWRMINRLVLVQTRCRRLSLEAQEEGKGMFAFFLRERIIFNYGNGRADRN